MNKKTQSEEIQFQISDLYHKLLEREPDSFGLKYWKDKVTNGKMTIDQIATSFINSEEYSFVNPYHNIIPESRPS